MFAKPAILCFLVLLPSILGDYWSDRQAIIDAEQSQIVGSSITLTADEENVNKMLMELKYAEFDSGFQDPASFLPSRHFFEAKSGIEESPVFQMLKNFPKGASLHSHDTALSSFDILYNLTYWADLYGCVVDERLRLYFFSADNVNTECDWKLLSESRVEVVGFDDWLKTQISIVVDDPKQVYTDINTVWNAFIDTFITVTPMLTYRPVFVEYFKQVLQELHDDNVMYLEFRGTLPTVYELDGTVYSPAETVGFYKDAVNDFVEANPEFVGAKYIYAPSRRVDNNTFGQYMRILGEIQEAHGDFIAGFDLVGQEDLGFPLTEFIDQIQIIQQTSNVFFHAGETNWYGSPTDLNLVDAVLLGTKRIGHGYALVKRPELMKRVKANKIAVEVNPISNQVLLLVEDLRNHPASVFFANDLPVVICSDDPSFWGAKGLSYDWYEAFMGIASREADLKTLKQLALNSLEYSALTGADKERALALWETKWQRFIADNINAPNKSEFYVTSFVLIVSLLASSFLLRNSFV